MLALYRKVQESFYVDLREVELEGIPRADRLLRFQVLEIRDGGKVRIGCHAPRAIPIHREEVLSSVEKIGQIREPNDLMNAAPKLLAVAQEVFQHLHDLPELTEHGRKLLAMATEALKVAQPDLYFDAEAV